MASWRVAEKGSNCREQRRRLLDVWHVSRTIDRHELRAERSRGARRRLERDRVLPSVDDQGGNMDGVELAWREQIEIVETLPDRLLNAARHAKRREIVRCGGIGEIAGDTQ